MSVPHVLQVTQDFKIPKALWNYYQKLTKGTGLTPTQRSLMWREFKPLLKPTLEELKRTPGHTHLDIDGKKVSFVEVSIHAHAWRHVGSHRLSLYRVATWHVRLAATSEMRH